MTYDVTIVAKITKMVYMTVPADRATVGSVVRPGPFMVLAAMTKIADRLSFVGSSWDPTSVIFGVPSRV